MNPLTLKKPAFASEVKNVIRISSQNPLPPPSFNLVILEKYNSGNMLDNFLVTLDFQKDLALNALGRKIKSSMEKEKILQSGQSRGLPDQEDAKLSGKPERRSSRPPSISFGKVSAVAPIGCSFETLAEPQNAFWGNLGCLENNFLCYFLPA